MENTHHTERCALRRSVFLFFIIVIIVIIVLLKFKRKAFREIFFYNTYEKPNKVFRWL